MGDVYMNKFPGLTGSSNLHVEVLVGLIMTLPYLMNVIVSCAKCFLGEIGRVSGQDLIYYSLLCSVS
jgi:hypothetical protein